MKLNSSTKAILQDHSVDLISVLIGLRKQLAYMNLNYIGTSFRSMIIKKDTNTFKMFEVTIINSKCAENLNLYSDTQMLNYRKKLLNSCCFRSLSSAFDSIKQTNPTNDIVVRIEK